MIGDGCATAIRCENNTDNYEDLEPDSGPHYCDFKESTIEIMNLRTDKPSEPWDVKVDRSSVLGNPYPIHFGPGGSRDEVCDKYDKEFPRRIESDYAFAQEIHRLFRLYMKHGKLRLFCWCFPKRCHVETIKEYLESVV